MENTQNSEHLQHEAIQLLDTYNDEHWLKRYGVSSDELKSVPDMAIPARIIQVNKRAETLHA